MGNGENQMLDLVHAANSSSQFIFVSILSMNNNGKVVAGLAENHFPLYSQAGI